MEFLYTFFIAFSIVFIAELGDKTQLLVLSFSSKNKISNILIGIALGTFLSHGIAIFFGGNISNFTNLDFKFYLDIFTYTSFIILGIIGFLPSKESSNSSHHKSILQKICSLKTNYIFIVALCIFIGEIGDKTFLASLGLGIQYYHYKLSLILGCICGMVLSNLLAILFGKIINSKLNSKLIETLSNIIFILFGILGFINMVF